MSNLEHYFENLLWHGADISGEPNKNALSKEQQEAVEECAMYIISTIFCGRKDFLARYTEIKALEQEPKWIPKDLTNGQVFIHVFGIDAWKQMIEFSNLNKLFREYWNAPYKAESEDK